MQNKFIIIGLAFIVAAGTIIACNSSAANEKEQKPLSQEELVQRGRSNNEE